MKQSDTGWKRLSAMKDKKKDFSDNRELDSDFFANAIIRMPEPNKPTIRNKSDSNHS